jgi:hypothetical protein
MGVSLREYPVDLILVEAEAEEDGQAEEAARDAGQLHTYG